ncbi:MAG: molecular chaperone [Clostridiales bacterium]|jgi:hypothetical protein|nr:molecular chaperone [Clostridiales bacterium]
MRRKHVAKKKVSREEKETIILFNETDEPVSIYTFNTDLKRRLKAFGKKHPELCRKTKEDAEYGSMTFEVEKARFAIRLTAPYSDERRTASSEYAKVHSVAANKAKKEY